MDAKLPKAQSADLTPNDIKNKDFTKAMLGYAPKEVVTFLDATAKAWERVQRHEKELLDRIHSLHQEILQWKSREGEIERLKEKVALEAQAIRDEAQKLAEKRFAEVEIRANAIRVKTEEWLETVIAEVVEAERQKLNFMTAFKSALDSHYELLRNERAQSEPLSQKLTQFLKTTMSQSH